LKYKYGKGNPRHRCFAVIKAHQVNFTLISRLNFGVDKLYTISIVVIVFVIYNFSQMT